MRLMMRIQRFSCVFHGCGKKKNVHLYVLCMSNANQYNKLLGKVIPFLPFILEGHPKCIAGEGRVRSILTKGPKTPPVANSP